VLGPWWIAKQRVARRNNDDLRLDHRWVTLLTRAGDTACGGVRGGER
jgi:hypothetical protein